MKVSRPIESSMLLPKIQRNSMFPPRCSRLPCMNIEVKIVSHGEAFPEPKSPPAHWIWLPDTSLTHSVPGSVSSIGMAPYSTTRSFPMSPRSQRPCSKRKYTITLIAISAIVTMGSRLVGMSSLRGSNLRRGLAGRGRRLREGLLRVVARADERSGGHRLEAHGVGLALQLGELVRVPVADHRQVVARRAQVLTHREHLHAVVAEDAEGLEQLLLRLAEAGHDPRLRHDLVAAHLLRVPEHAAGAQEARAAPGKRIQPRHGLDVVVEDVRALGDHARQRHLLAAEVGRQHLDLAAGSHPPDRADHADERAGAEIGQVVAVHARDHRVAQAHSLHRLGHAQRLERVVVCRLAGLHVAEPAAPGAGVAEDHERGRAALPAFPDVGAGGLLADGVEALALDHPAELAIGGTARRRALEPGRLALAEGANLAHQIEHPGAARVRARARAHAATRSRSRRRRGETIRWRMPNASAKRHAIRLRKQGRRPARPLSRATDVIRTWSIPHGTIHSNGWRSLSTFTARPCVVTPPETRTPIEAILESPAHTPV